jgi:hypothetical protein
MLFAEIPILKELPPHQKKSFYNIVMKNRIGILIKFLISTQVKWLPVYW